MSLKLGVNWKQIIKWAVVTLIGLFVVVFFVRVATWEDAYYREKEGSERDTMTEQVEEVELDETVPTEEEVREYTVDPDKPRYLTIEKLGIENARVISVGINAGGDLGTPNNIFDVGWYELSGKPGDGKTLLIDGHNGGPHVHGVFKDLPELAAGDIITVERGDGVKFNYYVMENIEVSIDESDVYMATAMRSPEAGRESLSLISCTGEWSQTQGTYLSRQFVRAVLVSRSDQTEKDASFEKAQNE